MRWFASAVLLAAALAAPPAMAQSGWGMSSPAGAHVGELSPLSPTHRYWTACLGDDTDAAIHACGRIIGARVSGLHTATAHYFRSIALQSAGEDDQAQRDLRRAYYSFNDMLRGGREEEDALALYGRGLSLVRMGHRAEGEADITRAIALSEGQAGEFFDISG
jgi:tetratricopeptide (TPR) repeat protein